MRLSYGRPRELETFAALLEEVPDKELLNTTRSTVPLLAWWRNPKNIAALGKVLGVSGLESAEACFEYAVPAACDRCPTRGKGTSSMTDVMIDAGTDVVAVEAKHTEPVYETVGKWLGSPPTANRQKVLRHWISCCIQAPFDVEDCRELIYQMVHGPRQRAIWPRRADVVRGLTSFTFFLGASTSPSTSRRCARLRRAWVEADHCRSDSTSCASRPDDPKGSTPFRPAIRASGPTLFVLLSPMGMICTISARLSHSDSERPPSTRRRFLGSISRIGGMHARDLSEERFVCWGDDTTAPMEAPRSFWQQ